MSCPLIESSHPQCSAYLCLQHLEEAYEFCSDHYYQCPIFFEMNRAQPQPVDDKLVLASK